MLASKLAVTFLICVSINQKGHHRFIMYMLLGVTKFTRPDTKIKKGWEVIFHHCSNWSIGALLWKEIVISQGLCFQGSPSTCIGTFSFSNICHSYRIILRHIKFCKSCCRHMSWPEALQKRQHSAIKFQDIFIIWIFININNLHQAASEMYNLSLIFTLKG